VENETYLGIRIYRFYIKCTRCLQEISFKTDPVSTDYIIEAGASRNFMALKLAEEQAEREEAAEREEEATNPMKMLEKRTEASKNEMASLEALEELKELNQRKINLDYSTMLGKYDQLREEEVQREMDEEDEIIEELLGRQGKIIKRIADDDSDDSEDGDQPIKKSFKEAEEKPTNLLMEDEKKVMQSPRLPPQEKSVGMLSVNKKGMGMLIKKKTTAEASSKVQATGGASLRNADKSVPSSSVNNTDGKISEKGTGSLSMLGAYSSSDDSD